jgi:hypothetical protein
LHDWKGVAHELAGAHTAAAPPGLLERVRALLEHAHDDWTGHVYALEVDEGGAEAIRMVHASLTGRDAQTEQRAASVAEAERIISDHQRHE